MRRMWCTFLDDWHPQWLALVQAFWGVNYGQTQKQEPRRSSRISTRVWSINAQTKEKRNNGCSVQSNNLDHTSSPKIQKSEHALFDLHTMRAKSTWGPKWKEAELNTNCRSNCCRVTLKLSYCTYSSLRAMSRGVYSLLFRAVEIQLKTSLLNH